MNNELTENKKSAPRVVRTAYTLWVGRASVRLFLIFKPTGQPNPVMLVKLLWAVFDSKIRIVRVEYSGCRKIRLQTRDKRMTRRRRHRLRYRR